MKQRTNQKKQFAASPVANTMSSPSGSEMLECSVLIEYFHRMADACDLTELERLALLGPLGGPPAITRTTIERISGLFEVWNLLMTLIPDQPQALAWMKRPNDNPLFGGEPPLARLIRPGGLEAVIRLLKGQVNVW